MYHLTNMLQNPGNDHIWIVCFLRHVDNPVALFNKPRSNRYKIVVLLARIHRGYKVETVDGANFGNGHLDAFLVVL